MKKALEWMRVRVDWKRGYIVVAVLLAFIAGGIAGESSAKEEAKESGTTADPTTDSTSDTELAAATAALGAAQEEISTLEAEQADLQGQIAAMTAEAPLPDLTGEAFSTAQTLLSDSGWVEGKVTFEETDSKPEGTILSQSPEPGTKMHFGDSVDFVVSQEPPPGWKDLKVWSGSGSFNTPEVNIPDGKVRLLYTFTGNTYTGITMYQRPNQYVESFLNEIGDRSANTRVYYSGRYYFTIEGGSWTVQLQVFE